ncbi:MAG: tRNA N6-adenosine threonylcarbamoyltransferase [Firmicutes bacterium]|nr:tRNA N6-adenosine threonylcarbamoyltransferase [Bacillota bacterium]
MGRDMIQGILGIDTSNYTTSAALVSDLGEVLADSRMLLSVREGEVGLRQSDALFLHVRNWPELLKLPRFSGVHIGAVAVATRPSPIAGSYMPVFLAGQAFAATVATMLGVPLLEFSHQEGHVRAALSARWPLHKPFLAVQISGGTTDILFVAPLAEGGFMISHLGRSSDLHAGQFIDRVGVHMGLAFPCGVAMDELATTWENEGLEPFPITSSVKASTISFSGPASMAMRALDQGVPRGAVALGVFRSISNSLEKVLREHQEKAGEVLLCGGVAANTHIRRRLQARLKRFAFILAPPHLAGDNAVGIALLGADRMQRDRGLC